MAHRWPRPPSIGHSSVRARLLALILLAAVPLFAMAASIAWQNYRIVADRSRQQAKLLLAAAAARNDAVLGQAERLLDGLAETPSIGVGGPPCTNDLQPLLRIFGERYRRLQVVLPDGQLGCAAGSPSVQPLAAAALLGAVRRSDRFLVGGVSNGTVAGRPVLIVGAPLRRAGSFAGIVVAELQIDWLTVPVISQVAGLDGAAWLVDPQPPLVESSVTQGRLVEVGGTPGAAPSLAAQPAPQVLAALLRPGASSRIAESREGAPYSYAVARLAGGATLLVGVPASADIARADAVLGRRLAELGLLLLAGLVAVVLGARLLVVQPTASLTQAVRTWRDGGAFDPGRLHGAPTEIVELARTFGQATTALRGREAELRAAMTRQDLLIQEIHHRVKNNLQIVASLLNLQASRIRLPEARAEFQAARDRIRALATLHRHLYAHDELQAINMRSFLGELCGQLLQAIGETPAGGRIRLDIEAMELQISSDQAVPIALIVTEAVSNAAKYAFPGGRSGHIRVGLRRHETAEGQPGARLEIEDDGVGIPAGRADTETGVRDGIGIQLIRGFARQLGATLVITQDGGTRYEVDIPLRPRREDGDGPGAAED